MASRDNWRRLSPLAMIHFVLKAVPQAVNLWPALVGIWAAGEAVRGFFLAYGALILAIILVLTAFLPYWFFRFRVAEDHIQVHSGVFQRKRLTLYFERVQQADINQPIFFRPFGLASLTLESAGSSQAEVDLPGLPLATAHKLKTLILSQRTLAQASNDPKSHKSPVTTEGAMPADGNSFVDERDEADYSLQLPWHEVARYGLMHNGLLFLLPLAAPILNRMELPFEAWISAAESSQFHHSVLTAIGGNAPLLLVLAGAMAIGGALLLVYCASAAIALTRFWNYRLTRTGDSFQYRAGLMTIKTRGFRLHKLQLIVVYQGVVARCLKRYTLSVSKAGGAGGSSEAQQEQQHFLVPVMNPEQLLAISEQFHLPTPRWQQVHIFYLWLNGTVTGALLAVPGAFMLAATDFPPWLALAAMPLCWLLAWRYWNNLSYFHDADWFAVKRGFIGFKIRWQPVIKIQNITLIQPPWLRPLGLVNVKVMGVDGISTITCIPNARAIEMRNQLIDRVANASGRWL